ncbi:hypothetical protein IAT38_006404 [Cryptococcus sp. DSM 104549]
MEKTRRATPEWAKSTVGATSSRPPVKSEVKDERKDDGPAAKRVKTNAAGGWSGTPGSSHGMFNDRRTVVVAIFGILKQRKTMNYMDAYYQVEAMNTEGAHPSDVLTALKAMDNVKYSDANSVFSYVPPLELNNLQELRNHIRVHSTPTLGIPVKDLREAMPQGLEQLRELEDKGDILIMRGLTGAWKDIPLPKLGRKNFNGLGVTEGGQARWKTVFWDHLKEAGKAGKRVDDEFIHAWADVPMAETDDVAKLLADQELSASSRVPEAPKPVAQASKKKKKRSHALKITNTHMKEQGIDFSQDYERPS